MDKKAKDITLRLPDGQFNFRVAYLAFKNEKILLQKGVEGHWFIPGGRVSLGEDTKAAIEREVQEELSIPVQNPEKHAFSETLYMLHGKLYHELATYYTIELTKDFILPTEEADGEKIELSWFDEQGILSLESVHPAVFKLYEGISHCKPKGFLEELFCYYTYKDKG